MRSSGLLAASLLTGLGAALTCPPLGQVLPNARNASAHPAVRAALDGFVALLEAETATYAGSAVSIGAKSAHDDEALLDFHFTPPDRDPRGVQAVDRDTVYRVASVSKVFAVLAALQRDDVIRLEDPVTKFLPELRGRADGGELEHSDWDEITVEAVAAHLSGIGAEIFTDGAAYPGDWGSVGLPPVSAHEKPTCGGFLGVPPCSRGDFISVFKNRRPPNYPVYQTPVYANPGTTVVGLVVEAATGKPFEQVLKEAILDPAGMTNTYYPSAPDLEKMFIPVNDTMYDWDLGVFAPSGAVYSSTADMLKFGDAILQHRLLSGPKTRRWLKPSTFTSGVETFVGMPWEGFISDKVTGDGRLVEMYTKGGDLINYHAMLVLVPEYNLTVSILVAGPEVSDAFSYYLEKFNALLPPLVQGLGAAARDEAEDRIAGTYADAGTGSRITLAVDGGWGVKVEEWVVRGFDVPANLQRYSFQTVDMTELPPNENITARVYPTGLREGNTTAWRAVFDRFTAEQQELIDGQAFWGNASCVTWGSIDRNSYNHKGLDHFEFTYGDDGRVDSVSPKAFAVELKRVE